MVYVISDMHGMYDKYISMLEKINFSDGDKLYVLGDSMDRGEDGIKIMQDMMKRKNVLPILGNHDDMAVPVLSVLIHPELANEYYYDENLDLWEMNGGGCTIDHALSDLSAEEIEKVIEYIKAMPLYREIELNGYKFFLSHSLPDAIASFDLHTLYDKDDFIWGRQNYSNRYSGDNHTCVITGHTPTVFINPEYTGRIFMGNGNIGIDCGACFPEAGGRLGCLCLDTMEEFYV